MAVVFAGLVASSAQAFALGKAPTLTSTSEVVVSESERIESVGAVRAAATTRETVAVVETDAFEGTYKMDLLRDAQGAVLALIYVTSNEGEKTFPIDLLKKGYQVLKVASGKNAVMMKVDPSFNPAKGGYGTLRILHNGMSGSYMTFRVLVDVAQKITLRSDPDRNDSESDGNAYTGPFNYLFMEKNTFLGMTIGIDEIRPALR